MFTYPELLGLSKLAAMDDTQYALQVVNGSEKLAVGLRSLARGVGKIFGRGKKMEQADKLRAAQKAQKAHAAPSTAAQQRMSQPLITQQGMEATAVPKPQVTQMGQTSRVTQPAPQTPHGGQAPAPQTGAQTGAQTTPKPGLEMPRSPIGAGYMVGVPTAAGAGIGALVADEGDAMGGAMRGAVIGAGVGGGAALGGRGAMKTLGQRFKGLGAAQASGNVEKFQRMKANYNRLQRGMGAKGVAPSVRKSLPMMMGGAAAGGAAGLAGQHMLFNQGGEQAQPAEAYGYDPYGYDPQTLAYYQQMGYL